MSSEAQQAHALACVRACAAAACDPTALSRARGKGEPSPERLSARGARGAARLAPFFGGRAGGGQPPEARAGCWVAWRAARPPGRGFSHAQVRLDPLPGGAGARGRRRGQ